MTVTRRTLLEPGHEAEWRMLNAQKRRALEPAPTTPLRELIDDGIALSRAAVDFLRAVDDGRLPPTA